MSNKGYRLQLFTKQPPPVIIYIHENMDGGGRGMSVYYSSRGRPIERGGGYSWGISCKHAVNNIPHPYPSLSPFNWG